MPVSVSVIIPCFNQGQFVDEAVDSVLAQSYQDFEIIIVNDGSTDADTNRLLQSYDRPKTRVVSTDNQGLSAARNNGIRAANGEYVLPLDADDRIGPTYLEQAVKLLDKRPELGIVYCRAQLFGAVDTEWQLPEFSLDSMLLDNVIFCSALFRRCDWQAVGGYDESLTHGWEDYDFWLSLLEKDRKVYQILEILFYYRVSADSMVRARPRQHKLETFTRIYQKHQSLYSENIHIWIDKLLDVREQYHEAALFVKNQDFQHPDEQLVRKVDIHTNRLEFQFPEENESGELIFKVADDYVIVRLKSISIENQDSHIPLEEWTSNADVIEDGVFVFCNDNPVFCLKLPENANLVAAEGKLVVHLEYLAFGRDCLPILLDVLQAKKEVPAEMTGQEPEVKELSIFQGLLLWWSRKKVRLRSLKNYFFDEHFRLIKKSGLFDENYYLEHNSHVDPLVIDPLIHYLEAGWHEQRSPNPLFEAIWYGKKYQLDTDQNPLLHYLQEGWQAGNNPNLLFFTSYYAEKYPESLRKGQTPLSHYLHQGWQEGKNPNPCFDTAYYLEHNPEIIELKQNPLFHYYHTGNPEQRSPMPFFDMRFYCEDNPKALEEWLFPLLHYYEHGAAEGRSPNRFFDPVYYKNSCHLTDLSGIDLFLHYVYEGAGNQYRPSALFDPVYYAESYPEYRETHSFPLSHYQESGIYQGLYPCREVAGLEKKPVISILTPVFNTDELLLRKCIHSVLCQAYPHWELCLADDGSTVSHVRQILEEFAARDKRIKICFLAENQGIAAASNAAAALATGDYLGFLDHDDELTLDALYEMVLAINQYDPEVLYSDEDLVNRDGRYLETFFKPDFNPELLLCHNYITHFLVTRRSLFEEVGGFAAGSDGSQDYDLLLKLTERTDRIHHIRRSIYKWRATETSTSINHNQKDYADAAGLRALQSAIERRGIQADVCSGQWQYYYDVHRLTDIQPHISIISLLPEDFQDTSSWLKILTDPIRYQHFDIQLLCRAQVSSGGNDSLPVELVDKVTSHEIFDDESDAAALNRVAGLTGGEYLVFLRGGVVPQESTWIETFLGYSSAGQCGVVGGMVTGHDGQVENPAVPDITDWSCRMFRSFLVEGSFHLNGVVCPQNVIAVSFDYCMVHRSSFQKIAGFDAGDFPRYLYDIDLCLRLRGEGVEHVVTPFCPAVYQYQSKESGDFIGYEKERRVFQQRWQEILVRHPYYNEQRLLLEQDISRGEWLHWVAGIDKGINGEE